MYEEDFVDESIVEFIIDNKKFTYKPVTAGEENSWLDECMTLGEDGKLKQSFSKLNECKVMNIRSVPYDEDTIQKIVGAVNTQWSNLSKELRWKLLGKLKGKMFDKIFAEITRIDKPDDSKKKAC